MIKSISLEKISNLSLYVLVFLIPLWFLPFTQDMLNFQKQALLIMLVIVGFVTWLASVVKKQEINLRTTWLHLLVLGVLIACGISSIASLWQYGSFWGWPANVSDSFITLLFFVLLYFLISQT